MHQGPLLDLISDSADAALIRSYERHCRAANHSPRTIEHRNLTLRRFVGFCQAEFLPGLRFIRKEHVEAWMESLQAELASNSVASYTSALRAFFSWLVDEEEIEKHPMARIKAPFAERVDKDLVADKDMLKVVAMLEKQKRWRDLALIALIFDQGLRASEVANCLVSDCDLDAGTARVMGKGRKPRTVPLTPKVVRYLDRYLRSPRRAEDYLITGRVGQLTRTGVYRAIRRCFAEAGVTAVIGSHDLRHTWASNIAGEVSDSDMMAGGGWSTPGMVQHYTAQVRTRKSIEALRKASPLDRLYRK